MSAGDRRFLVLRRLLLAAVGILAALALAEGALRWTGFGFWEPRIDDFQVTRVPTERFWRFVPGSAGSHRWDGDPYGTLPPGAKMEYAFGADGLRGEPPDPARPVVLVLGDSFTFGEGVRVEDTFSARLERAFAGRAGAPCFVNAGVPGYGTVEEAARLPELLARYRPRAVLLVAIPNDAVPARDEVRAPNLLNDRESGAPSGLRVVALIRTVAGRRERERAMEAWYLSYYFGDQKERWVEARRAFDSIRSNCAARNIPLGVALFPLIYRMEERPFARIHTAFAAACADRDIPFLDLLPFLAVEPERALWVHPTDHHPNRRGHELAAAGLGPFVEALLR
jgi:lysophospholipase L1-like esterase